MPELLPQKAGGSKVFAGESIARLIESLRLPINESKLKNMVKKIVSAPVISDEIIIGKILIIRNQRVMIDKDIAELYGVSTKRLNEQVKRNRKRFPADFMFQLTKTEKDEVVAICDHLKTLKFSSNLPYAFTEHGAVMLASVLNSERAIAMNTHIVRIFIQLRQVFLMNKDVLTKLDQLEKRIQGHDENIQTIFKALRQLIPQQQEPRRRIGFRRKDETD